MTINPADEFRLHVIAVGHLSFYRSSTSTNWTIVGEPAIIKLIRSSGIHQDPLKRANNSIVVPDWVKSAIDAYSANDGYGGMYLGEYLNKIGGDFKAKK